MGYAINALIDFDDEIDIISHLMVGSEGHWVLFLNLATELFQTI